MNWEQMRKHYYRADGSFRDIFVADMDELTWQNFFDCLEGSGATVKFEYVDGEQTLSSPTIRRDIVELQWTLREFVPVARVSLAQKVSLTIYFFAADELEASFDPRCIRNEASHKILFGFLCKLSNAMDKMIKVSGEGREKLLYNIKPRPPSPTETSENFDTDLSSNEG